MSFDYYASLAENKACPKRVNESGLASGFGDGCVVWPCRDGEKNNARQCYMKQAAEPNLQLPPDLGLDPNFTSLPSPDWVGFEFAFTLKTPWYSKDDRPFHVLDNPVRKDRVFGAPFMAASSWKGLLRWACRMGQGLLDHLNTHEMRMDEWEDEPWIVHLFGNEKGEDSNFRAGALAFYPTWFSKVDFEVINPHDRAKKAGKQPIYYEVVPVDAPGVLHLLYAPAPGAARRDKVKPEDALCRLVDAIQALLSDYGISAKRTAGWGTAEIQANNSKAWLVEGGWAAQRMGPAPKKFEPPKEEFGKLLDGKGNPIDCLVGDDGKLLSKTQFRKLRDKKPCEKAIYEAFCTWHENYGSGYKEGLDTGEKDTSAHQTRELPFGKFVDALKQFRDTRKGGNP